MDNFWKDKKIIAYVALLHHTRFIIPVMERLAGLGADTRYVVAQAERSQEITAVECQLNYVHIFDYLSPEDFDDIQGNYLKERKVFSRSLSKDFALGTQMITVMDKTLYNTAQEYIGFRNMIRDEKPDLCFALHELNRWGKMLGFWAKKFNVPFITLQEGLGYNHSFGYTGHVQYSTLDLVWGERIKKKFSDYDAPVERIIPVGNTHLSSEKARQEKNNIRKKMRKKLKLNKKTVPLLLFTANPPEFQKISPLLEKTATQSNIKIIIKFHPACKHPVYESWKAAIPKPWHKNLIFVHGEYNTYDLMSASDLCVLAAPSTTGIESIALGKPLIQLKGISNADVPYSFTDQGVALDMTPTELGNTLAEGKSFKEGISLKAIDQFLKNELTCITGATDRITDILEKVIRANKATPVVPLPLPGPSSFDWSFVVLVSAHSPKDFLFQLQSITNYSEEQGTYEVILIEPETVCAEVSTILESLSGDIVRIKQSPGCNAWATINQKAVPAMRGEKIAVLSELACPTANWLSVLNESFSKYGSQKVFGGKILDPSGSIIHAGIVLNANNAPVSAYMHLDDNFAQANREREFLMVDHMVSLSRKFFARLGGFSPETSENAILDLCLKARDNTGYEDACIYLPGLVMLKNPESKNPGQEAAIHFYARWHKVLWDNEDNLYKKDNISRQQLDGMRMARAQQLAGRV